MVIGRFGHPENDEENEVALEVITIEADSPNFTCHGEHCQHDSNSGDRIMLVACHTETCHMFHTQMFREILRR